MSSYIKVLVVGFIFLIGLQSCGESSVKEEVQAYCDCIHGVNDSNTTDCMDMIEEITIKYEYDPEALEIIEKELAICNAE